MKNTTLAIITCCVLALGVHSSSVAADSTRAAERRARHAELQNQREQRRIAKELAAQEEAQRQRALEEQRQKEAAEREAKEAEERAYWENVKRTRFLKAIPARIITAICFFVWVAGIVYLTMKVKPQRYSSENVFCPKCGSPGLLLSEIHSDGIIRGSGRADDYENGIHIKSTSKHQTGASLRAAPPIGRFMWPLSAVVFLLIWHNAEGGPVISCFLPILLAAGALYGFAHGRKTNAYGRWRATRRCQGCGHEFYSEA